MSDVRSILVLCAIRSVAERLSAHVASIWALAFKCKQSLNGQINLSNTKKIACVTAEVCFHVLKSCVGLLTVRKLKCTRVVGRRLTENQAN